MESGKKSYKSECMIRYNWRRLLLRPKFYMRYIEPCPENTGTWAKIFKLSNKFAYSFVYMANRKIVQLLRPDYHQLMIPARNISVIGKNLWYNFKLQKKIPAVTVYGIQKYNLMFVGRKKWRRFFIFIFFVTWSIWSMLNGSANLLPPDDFHCG